MPMQEVVSDCVHLRPIRRIATRGAGEVRELARRRLLVNGQTSEHGSTLHDEGRCGQSSARLALLLLNPTKAGRETREGTLLAPIDCGAVPESRERSTLDGSGR